MLRDSHKKIVDAIVKKAEAVCPDSLKLIGVYGSAMTGDTHAKSDLDLMIVIEDEAGAQLSAGFILEDEDIGYDIYCTTWESLKEDAKCPHAQLSKLMDSKIVYSKDEESLARLENLRKEAHEVLSSEKRFESISELRKEMSEHYGYALCTETLGEMRAHAAVIVYLAFDIVMLTNGRYFKHGVKRNYEEVREADMPAGFLDKIDAITGSEDQASLFGAVTDLYKSVMDFSKREKDKKLPSPEEIRGTYEEMFSNWKNKMPEAAENGNRYASFMNLACMFFMIEDIGSDLQIHVPDVLDKYDPKDLFENVRVFDNALDEYRKEYEKAGITPVIYKNVDSFIQSYLQL